VVLISTVVLSVAHGIGQYILTSMNSTGMLKGVPNYIGQLNLTTVLTFIGVALMVAGAVVILMAIFEVAKGARQLWGGGGAE
jgi:formate hydrogenlyase subunit 4